MKSKLLLSAICCLVAFTLKAQNQDDPKMKAWMAYMTPGEAQQMMAKSVGDWKAETTWWMDPSQPPQKSTGMSHNEMIMGGRYLTTKFTGTMMGQPFEGLGTMAYDNGMKKYISTWVDNMGTGIGYMEGMKSADGKKIEFKGKSWDPTQGKEVMMREVMTFNSDNDHMIEMYGEMKGKEMKMMEIHLTR
jgi:hypothetical protein